MDTTTLRGEKTLQALTERLYGRLNGEQQQRAEMLLLEANPGLDAIGRLPIGSLLAVPSLPGITVTLDVKKDDPQGRINQETGADLETYRKELREAVAEAQQQLVRQMELVAGDTHRGLIGDDRHLNEVVNTLIDNLKQRRKELKQRDVSLAEDPLE